MGASGHGFYVNSTDKIALVFGLCGIFILPNFKNKRISNSKTKTLILSLSIIIAIGTFIVGISVLEYYLIFEFGNDISAIVIALHYLIPLIFISINGMVINEILADFWK